MWRDFPEKCADIEGLLESGLIFLSYVPDIRPVKKPKIQIVVGITTDRSSVATVFVNSGVNEKVHDTDEGRRLQIKLEAESRGYLKCDSYVDCTKIKGRETCRLMELISNSKKRFYCKISNEDLRRVRDGLCSSNIVTKEENKRYGLTS